MSIYQPPSYAPPVPPEAPHPPRKTPWYRTAWFVGLMGFILGAAIAGSVAGSVSKTKTITGPERVVTSTVPGPTVTETAAPCSSAPPPPAAGQGNVLAVGKTMTVTSDGTPAADLTITSVENSTRPVDEYSSAPKNGYFVTAHVTVKALSSYTAGFDIYSGDFYAVVKGTHYEEGNGNAFEGPGRDSALDSMTLNAGETASGTLNFDLPAQHGRIAYSPNSEGGPVGYWTF